MKRMLPVLLLFAVSVSLTCLADSNDAAALSDADLKNTITNGKGKMPSYKSLTPEQVDGLVKYVRELGK